MSPGTRGPGDHSRPPSSEDRGQGGGRPVKRTLASPWVFGDGG